MKRIITILLFLAFVVTVNAKWIESARGGGIIMYVETKMTYDEDGIYYILVKTVPMKSNLAKERKNLVDALGSTDYKKYTHSVDQYAVDFNSSQWILISTTYYGGADIINMISYNGETDWYKPGYGSLGSETIATARQLVKNAQRNNSR